MSFSGEFKLITSQRAAGVRIWSFSLKCTNWLQSETIDFMLCDCYERQPWYYRKQTIKAGQVFRFDYDTVGWQWYQGDYFAILGKNDKIEERWFLRLPEYGPGECPECHGTHRCSHCRGQGYSVDLKRTGDITACPYCGGTGTCSTCDVPRRPQPVGGGLVGYGGEAQATGGGSGGLLHRHRSPSQIQADMADVRSKLTQVEWDLRRMQMDGTNVTMHAVFRAYLLQKDTYMKQLLALEKELRSAT